LFTSGICDNLFTKHSTNMAYISKPLVSKFRTLFIRHLDLFKFEIHTILRNRLTLTTIFCEQYAFNLQTSSDVIDLTCVFYQKILC